jgi:arylsulfatase A-like enzyme
MADRPNILLAVADDASHFGCYGCGFVQTPNADRVARQGILFQNMFTTNPKCAPSRASMLTGMHTWQLKEACTHWCVFPGAEEFDVYPDILEDAGYHVGWTGKGWGPGDWQRRGRPRNPAGTAYNDRVLEPPANTGINKCDYAANFRDFLADRPEGAPFCFWYGGREPHRHYVDGEGLAHGKSLDQVDDIPPYWPQDDVVRSDMLDYAFEVDWFDAHLGMMLTELEERGELDNTLVIVTSDNGCPFPRVKGNMYDDDSRLPFVAMWPGHIEPGRVVDDLASFIDLMPTFLELAGLDIPEDLPGRSLLDVFNGKGSGKINPQRNRALMGRERHDLGREGDVGYPVRCLRTPEYLYVRNFRPELWPCGDPVTGFTGCDSSPTKSHIIELEGQGERDYHQLCFGKRPAEELFRITGDPHCMENLADAPEHQDVLVQLREELEEELRRTGDPRIFGNGDIFDTYEYVGHETAAHSWKAYKEGWWKPQRY